MHKILLATLVIFFSSGCTNEPAQPTSVPPAITSAAPAPGDMATTTLACWGEKAGEELAASVETTPNPTPALMFLLSRGICRKFEPATLIIERTLHALTDWEGDTAYLVQARYEGKPIEIYTVVWPHHVTAQPEQMRGQPI